MQLELTRMLFEEAKAAGTLDDESSRRALDRELSRLSRMRASELLKGLAARGLPDDLCQRIKDAIERRNVVAHRMLEDPELIEAITDQQSPEVVVKRIERLALDCSEIAVELQRFATRTIEASSGLSFEKAAAIVKAVDPGTISDRGDRRRLEALRALGDVDLSQFDLEAPGE